MNTLMGTLSETYIYLGGLLNEDGRWSLATEINVLHPGCWASWHKKIYFILAIYWNNIDVIKPIVCCHAKLLDPRFVEPAKVCWRTIFVTKQGTYLILRKSFKNTYKSYRNIYKCVIHGLCCAILSYSLGWFDSPGHEKMQCCNEKGLQNCKK